MAKTVLYLCIFPPKSPIKVSFTAVKKKLRGVKGQSNRVQSSQRQALNTLGQEQDGAALSGPFRSHVFWRTPIPEQGTSQRSGLRSRHQVLASVLLLCGRWIGGAAPELGPQFWFGSFLQVILQYHVYVLRPV